MSALTSFIVLFLLFHSPLSAKEQKKVVKAKIAEIKKSESKNQIPKSGSSMPIGGDLNDTDVVIGPYESLDPYLERFGKRKILEDRKQADEKRSREEKITNLGSKKQGKQELSEKDYWKQYYQREKIRIRKSR